MKKELRVVLNDFRSVYNTASCFRTADGAGVDKIYLTGTTAEPVDRFGRERKDFVKVSLGAEKSVEYKKVKDIFSLITDLKKEGWLVVAVEQDKQSEDLFEFVEKYKEELDSRLRGNDKGGIVLIFGNEVEGLSKEILKECDKILEIPMRGEKESLNVATAFGVAVYVIKEI